MSNIETAVRTAATALHDAIVAAQAAGYRIHFPRSPDELKSIAISETGKVSRELELTTIDPIADYTIVPKRTFASLPKKPKDKE